MEFSLEHLGILANSGYVQMLGAGHLVFQSLKGAPSYEACRPSFDGNLEDFQLLIPIDYESSRIWVYKFEPTIHDGIAVLLLVDGRAKPSTMLVYLYNRGDDAWIERPRKEAEEFVEGLYNTVIFEKQCQN